MKVYISCIYINLYHIFISLQRHLAYVIQKCNTYQIHIYLLLYKKLEIFSKKENFYCVPLFPTVVYNL